MKWCGSIGFAQTVETSPGVWTEEIVSKKYYGDEVRNIRRFQTSDGLNDNVNIANKISIVSDSFATKNFMFMRYIEYMGVKWKVTEIEPQYPRLIISVGGVYNEAE